MSTDNKTFIQVDRITRNRESGKNETRKETYNLSDIKNFRPWFKNGNHKDIEGDITMLTIGSPDVAVKDDLETDTSKDKPENKSSRPVLINEPYNDFLKRVNGLTTVL